LGKTTTVLQLADRSTVAPEGVVEDVMVSIDSREYLVDFRDLQHKTKFNGYPLILGRPWIATADAYVSCRARNMTIKNGCLSKQLVLYPPAQPSIEHDLPLWLEEEEEDEVYHTTSHPICTLYAIIGGGKPDEYDLIDQILQNYPPNTIPLDELVKESGGNPWTELCLVDPSPTHVKMVEFGPYRTLKIDPSLSSSQEEKLCNMMREHLDAFAWSYKEMKGVHP